MAEDESEDLGFTAWQSRQAPDTSPADILDKVLGDEDTVSSSPIDMMKQGRLKDPEPQPVNQATMECTRGPCRHLWALTAKSEAQLRGEERIQIARVSQCNAHYEPTKLTDANVYQCSLWWPAQLSWVPESLHAALRPHLRRVWEWMLKQRGYDFSWRWWPEDVFAADRRGLREHSGLGSGPATFVREAGLTEKNKPRPISVAVPGGVETAKGDLYFNMPTR